jgi:hypothetical protein
MKVVSMLDAAQDDAASCIPPRGGADSEKIPGNQVENDSDDESGDDDDGPAKKKISRGRRTWTELDSWDRSAMLDSEVDHQVLTLANQRMEDSGLVEWPQARRRDDNHYFGLWVRNGQYFRQGGRVSNTVYREILLPSQKQNILQSVDSSNTLIDFSPSGYFGRIAHAGAVPRAR